ncbi:hypothetical protein [Qipengyuania qiaonensis]|uniref:hypothetical protein n=1 Tax=Qipengyuania qiaonensis TaxID=2867240 RepID=UPI001C87DC8B|nr:hypothetical protein [Qipengyuania qiaonensis]
MAQEADEAGTDVAAQKKIDDFAAMMTGLFQTEPLTAEQQARLPAAQEVVGAMMPDGFYGKMMSEMIDKMLSPMMSMLAAPEFILGSRLDLEQETIEALADEEQVEIMTMLDPAYEKRFDATVGVLTGKMGGMFSTMEGPMREGLSKAYAVRFDDTQLADISAFFATPTGGVYARESMAMFADPQVMEATMQALPAVLSGLGDMESAMKEAMESLPTERGYGDLDPAERARLAALLEVDAESLREIVKPPKPMDWSVEDQAM